MHLICISYTYYNTFQEVIENPKDLCIVDMPDNAHEGELSMNSIWIVHHSLNETDSCVTTDTGNENSMGRA